MSKLTFRGVSTIAVSTVERPDRLTQGDLGRNLGGSFTLLDLYRVERRYGQAH
jgi:hypothetical protein